MGDRYDRSAAGSRSAPETFRLDADFRTPPEQFEGCFTTFYHLTLDLADPQATLSDLLQPEWANIRFFCGSTPRATIGTATLSDAPFVATGPSSRPCRFELGPVRMWGVGFLPLGWARFFDVEAATLANVVCDGRSHPAFRHFTPLIDTLCDPEAGIDEQYAALVAGMERLMRPTREEARIRRIHHELVGGEWATVQEFADACAMSIRTLERVCARYFGFPPKLLMRRQRFMRSLASFMLHKDSRWTEAMDAHYHDQAQFSREFREFMTMNPSDYAALDHPILTSFMLARAQARGSPVQTLDPPARGQ